MAEDKKAILNTAIVFSLNPFAITLILDNSVSAKPNNFKVLRPCKRSRKYPLIRDIAKNWLRVAEAAPIPTKAINKITNGPVIKKITPTIQLKGITTISMLIGKIATSICCGKYREK